jgi:hypothetical protein
MTEDAVERGRPAQIRAGISAVSNPIVKPSSVIASEARQSTYPQAGQWIAALSLAMTAREYRPLHPELHL